MLINTRWHENFGSRTSRIHPVLFATLPKGLFWHSGSVMTGAGVPLTPPVALWPGFSNCLAVLDVVLLPVIPDRRLLRSVCP